ncbi:MAG: tRNA (adenosine(37)-N6)-threonylcarbamoyltransferase complex dimerization subunit type 1 TsaB [Desulfobacteraceae bacterium]|nr:tRNA (adenosine(37)-N6)-threonylcarbamoyltransferase complex dimerization subunit type 1 TsaB [Desulfobacteraceae bacterium]
MNLLAIDTSAKTCSAALISKGKVKAEISANFAQTHARHVMELVDALMRTARMEIKEIDAYGVTTGPGSFTGLRIGISTIKGLSLAYGKPAAGVSSLLSLAHPLRAYAGLVCPVIDARKGEVYAEIYRFSDTGSKVILPACVCPPGELIGKISDLGESCLFAGSGAVLYMDRIIEGLGGRAFFAPDSAGQIRASTVAELAYQNIINGLSGRASELTPYYIRRSDAERKRAASA